MPRVQPFKKKKKINGFLYNSLSLDFQVVVKYISFLIYFKNYHLKKKKQNGLNLLILESKIRICELKILQGTCLVSSEELYNN